MQNQVITSFMETIKMGYIFNMRSNVTILETFISTLFFLGITYIISNEDFVDKLMMFFSELYYKRCNSILLEGKRCFRTTDYNTRSDQLFSNRFNAVWHFIAKNNERNKSIYSLKEFANSSNIYDENGDPYAIPEKYGFRSRHDRIKKSTRSRDIFIVNQKKKFVLAPDILCRVLFINEQHERKSNKQTMSNTETIRLVIFSYNKSLIDITAFIDNMTNDYISDIQDTRINKRYIYSFIGRNPKENDDYTDSRFEVWEECEFTSSRNFDNLFFDDRTKLVEKIKFFNENNDWYNKEGHPYTWGLGLSGPPGTGKTSIIKCIANMLNRHLIIIPLNKIKTQREFSQYYFESRYNKDNEPNSINFDNKIIVFEDIDCMTDIVKKRNNLQTGLCIDDNFSTNSLLKKLIKKINKNGKNSKSRYTGRDGNDNDEDDDDIVETDFTILNNSPKSDCLTLSYLLNIIDGIRETPGRILIITSNNYDSLDEALIRPGRIDFTLKMNNASVSTINNMFAHYYNISLAEFITDKLDKLDINRDLLRDHIISPAEVVNARLCSKTPEEFIITIFNILKKKQPVID